MRNLLLFRLYAVKFLEDNERASEDRAIDEFEKMEANLEILDRELQNPGRRAILADIREKDQIYKDAFEEVAQIIYTRNTVIESKLDVIGPQIASYAQDIFNSVEEDQGTTGDNVQGQNNFFIFLIIGMGLVAVMIGVAFAIWTTTSILAQLGADPAQIQEVAERVALGDLEMKNEDKGCRCVQQHPKDGPSPPVQSGSRGEHGRWRPDPDCKPGLRQGPPGDLHGPNAEFPE
jgi:methyl-accepting chemotaxis protein